MKDFTLISLMLNLLYIIEVFEFKGKNERIKKKKKDN